eukprot:scaffold1661_cov251-Pinguiococcus_pyrenoidosus.AAC.27
MMNTRRLVCTPKRTQTKTNTQRHTQRHPQTHTKTHTKRHKEAQRGTKIHKDTQVQNRQSLRNQWQTQKTTRRKPKGKRRSHERTKDALQFARHRCGSFSKATQDDASKSRELVSALGAAQRRTNAEKSSVRVHPHALSHLATRICGRQCTLEYLLRVPREQRSLWRCCAMRKRGGDQKHAPHWTAAPSWRQSAPL